MEQEEPEAVQALLTEKEIDLSVEEIEKIQDMLIKQLNGEMDMEELSDDDLEDVSGGSLLVLGSLIVLAMMGAGIALSGAMLDSDMRSRRRRW